MAKKKLKKKLKKVKSRKSPGKSEAKKKSGYKKGSLMKGIYDLFDRKGVDKVTYEETLKLAKSILPTTKFDKSHFSWYKNDYRNKQEE